MFKYAALTATKLDMISIVEVDGVRAMRCLYWSGAVSKFAQHFTYIGRSWNSYFKNWLHSKPKNRDVHCIFVDMYWIMMKPATR